MNSTALGIGTVGHPPLGRRPATWQTSRVLYSTRAEARLVDLSLPCGLSFALRCLTRRYSTALQHRLYVTPVHEISTMVLLFCGYFRCFCLTLPKCSAWSQDRLEYLLSGRIPMYCVLEKHLCNSMSTFTCSCELPPLCFHAVFPNPPPPFHNKQHTNSEAFVLHLEHRAWSRLVNGLRLILFPVWCRCR